MAANPIIGDKPIIMPTQTVEFSDPSTWEYPPVDEMFWEYIQ